MPEPASPIDPDMEIAYVIGTHAKDVQGELEALLPEADVESSDNFVGGAEIAVFAKLTLEVTKSILGFVSKNRDRVQSATLKIGATGIEISGYSPDQAKDLLESPAVQDAIAKYRA